MPTIDTKDTTIYGGLGAPIRPEPTKPPGPLPEGPSGVVTINGKAQTTSHPKPEVKTYGDRLETQGMIHRDSFPGWVQPVVRCGNSFLAPNAQVECNPQTELKWVGEAADAWRGIHAQQAADMAVIRGMGRKADRD